MCKGSPIESLTFSKATTDRMLDRNEEQYIDVGGLTDEQIGHVSAIISECQGLIIDLVQGRVTKMSAKKIRTHFLSVNFCLQMRAKAESCH